MSAVAKLLSPAHWKQSMSNFAKGVHNYYHPMMRQGSATPLWHMMIGISVLMYSTSYYARDYKRIVHERDVQKVALKEYYEKHGGAPDHH